MKELYSITPEMETIEKIIENFEKNEEYFEYFLKNEEYFEPDITSEDITEDGLQGIIWDLYEDLEEEHKEELEEMSEEEQEEYIFEIIDNIFYCKSKYIYNNYIKNNYYKCLKLTENVKDKILNYLIYYYYDNIEDLNMILNNPLDYMD
jgi:hypothetical protein